MMFNSSVAQMASPTSHPVMQDARALAPQMTTTQIVHVRKVIRFIKGLEVIIPVLKGVGRDFVCLTVTYLKRAHSVLKLGG